MKKYDEWITHYTEISYIFPQIPIVSLEIWKRSFLGLREQNYKSIFSPCKKLEIYCGGEKYGEKNTEKYGGEKDKVSPIT